MILFSSWKRKEILQTGPKESGRCDEIVVFLRWSRGEVSLYFCSNQQKEIRNEIPSAVLQEYTLIDHFNITMTLLSRQQPLIVDPLYIISSSTWWKMSAPKAVSMFIYTWWNTVVNCMYNFTLNNCNILIVDNITINQLIVLITIWNLIWWDNYMVRTDKLSDCSVHTVCIVSA